MHWLDEFRAAADARDGPLIAQFATVDAGGRPRVRSVVVRDVGDDGSLAFSSDARSRKNGQVRRNANAALHFWFEPQRVQFRLLGTAEVVRGGLRAEAVWADHSPSARALFAWPASGQPRAADAAFVPELPNDAPRPATFELIVLRPAEVDRLDLSQTPQARRVWRADRAWRGRDVNP